VRILSRPNQFLLSKENLMHRFTTSLVAAALLGQLVGLLGWVDPLFIPLALLGPVVSGAVAAAYRLSFAWIAVLWCSAGLNMTWTDWVVNHEDVVFHLVLSALMPALAGVGFGVVRLAVRTRRLSTRTGV
jgi:hypothetical protein